MRAEYFIQEASVESDCGRFRLRLTSDGEEGEELFPRFWAHIEDWDDAQQVWREHPETDGPYLTALTSTSGPEEVSQVLRKYARRLFPILEKGGNPWEVCRDLQGGWG